MDGLSFLDLLRSGVRKALLFFFVVGSVSAHGDGSQGTIPPSTNGNPESSFLSLGERGRDHHVVLRIQKDRLTTLDFLCYVECIFQTYVPASERTTPMRRQFLQQHGRSLWQQFVLDQLFVAHEKANQESEVPQAMLDRFLSSFSFLPKYKKYWERAASTMIISANTKRTISDKARLRLTPKRVKEEYRRQATSTRSSYRTIQSCDLQALKNLKASLVERIASSSPGEIETLLSNLEVASPLHLSPIHSDKDESCSTFDRRALCNMERGQYLSSIVSTENAPMGGGEHFLFVVIKSTDEELPLSFETEQQIVQEKLLKEDLEEVFKETLNLIEKEVDYKERFPEWVLSND